MSFVGGLLAGWTAVAGSILGGHAYKRRKNSRERLHSLEAELQELHDDSVLLDTGREWMDRDRAALSSKTLDATADVDVDFSEYDAVDEVLEEENLEGLGSSLLESMTDEYGPHESSIDRYNITFDGEVGSLSYSVPSGKFFDGRNEEGEMQLKSVDKVYSETFGDEECTSLS